LYTLRDGLKSEKKIGKLGCPTFKLGFLGGMDVPRGFWN
jgi:hypothetical protein